jgi:GIY-YIG catalytic domain
MSTEIPPALVVGEETAPTEITATQLRLLPAHSPLMARIGAEFFRGLPQQPGVYLMRDAHDLLIYVGKAKNLRQRLNSYRYPARGSRKTVRLVHAVRRIEWELCHSDEAAQLRENALLRTHRPRFNRLGTWPKANCFILIHAEEARLQFVLTQSSPLPPTMSTEENEASAKRNCELRLEMAAQQISSNRSQFFGAFKPGAAWALASLLRLLWQTLHQVKERTALPRRLLAEKSPAAFNVEHPTATAWIEPLTLYFTGESSVIIDILGGSLPSPTTTFEEQARQSDLEQLQHFFLVGPKLNREFNHRRANPGLPISQEELDDLMVLRRREVAAVTAPEP